MLRAVGNHHAAGLIRLGLGRLAIELGELAEGPEKAGFVILGSDTIEVTPLGQLFLRNVCMIFDRYLREKPRTGPTFSRTV